MSINKKRLACERLARRKITFKNLKQNNQEEAKHENILVEGRLILQQLYYI
jgi:hypothetical protein